METKTVKKVRFFSLTNWQEEQKFLSEQHKSGWKFVKMSANVYTFESCEPEDVIYQLDFRDDDSGKEEYLQMFRDCGWEYLQDYYGYSYFRKPAAAMEENEDGIFCDNESRLAMLQNVYRKKMLPLFTIFLLIILPQALGQTALSMLRESLIYNLLSIVYAILFVLYIVIFIKFGYDIGKFKKSIRK